MKEIQQHIARLRDDPTLVLARLRRHRQLREGVTAWDDHTVAQRRERETEREREIERACVMCAFVYVFR